MKKKLLGMVLAGILSVAALSGCGKEKTEEPKTQDEKDEDEEKEKEEKEEKQEPEEDGDIVGNDWRTWGIIDAYATMKTEEGDADICACLFADRAELYYDDESQTLFAQVDFTYTLSEEQYEAAEISFADEDGDGFTDITVSSEGSGDGDIVQVFLYDDGAYVYSEELSFTDSMGEGQGGVDYSGSFTDPMFGRCWIEIEHLDGVHYAVHVSWSGSASVCAYWDIEDAIYAESTGYLEYQDATYYIRTTLEDGTYTDELVYTDGSGSFWFDEDEGGKLGWMSDKSDVDMISAEYFEKMD